MQLEAATTNAGISDMGPTTGSTTPSFPNRTLIIGMAAASGLALGILLALLVELLNRRVRSTDDLEVAAGAPVLAVVGILRRRPMTEKLITLLEGRTKAKQISSDPAPEDVFAEAAE